MKHFITPITLSILLSIASACSSSNDEPTPTPPEPSTPSSPSYTGTRVSVTVLDYSPAPGQFINEIPEYEQGDTKASMTAKADEALNAGDMISLGAFGGSITIKLNSPIANSDNRDFRVIGNAYYTSAADASPLLGSSEPGIISVSRDINANGIADDQWYEIRGSETTTDYSLTYELLHLDNGTGEIGWFDTDGNGGIIPTQPEIHSQPYYPQWLDNPRMSISATRLPDNGYYNPENGNYEQYCYAYGYADTHPNDSYASCIDIDWAVDTDGNPVHLSQIDFIRIHTAIHQVNGGLGECSTEVAGIETLH